MTTPSITNEEDRGVSKMETPSGTQQAHLINESSIQHPTAADLSLCPPSEPPLIHTLPHPQSHPVLWTLDHLYKLEAILTDPVEKLSSDIEPGLQVYRTLTGQHLFTDQKTLLHSQNFSARFFELSFFLYNVFIL